MKRMKRLKTLGLVVVSVACLSGAYLSGADWRQFRGSDSRGVATDAEVPTHWDATRNVAWKVDLPGRGPGSPIVVGNRVFVTCSDGVKQDRLFVLCFDADTGKQLWRREFWATGRTLSHPQSANAAPTPASDGERIFAFFSSNDLICLDLDGNLQWYRGLAVDYPKTGNDVGMSASPLVVGDTVVVQVENQGDSFAAGMDTKNGKERWRIERDSKANWTSPILLPAHGARPEMVLLQSSSGLTAHEPRTGREVWAVEAECSTIPSAATSSDAIFLPAAGLTRLDLGSVGEPANRWESNRLASNSASPVVHNGRVFTLARLGVLKCADAETGQEIWDPIRLGGTYWATPVIAGNYLYCINYDGKAKVVAIGGEQGKVVATNDFEEKIQGTPAIAGNAMYVRSDAHLWKIAAE